MTTGLSFATFSTSCNKHFTWSKLAGQSRFAPCSIGIFDLAPNSPTLYTLSGIAPHTYPLPRAWNRVQTMPMSNLRFGVRKWISLSSSTT
jgi:hypothetical protein